MAEESVLPLVLSLRQFEKKDIHRPSIGAHVGTLAYDLLLYQPGTPTMPCITYIFYCSLLPGNGRSLDDTCWI